jgi:hypothetical protein
MLALVEGGRGLRETALGLDDDLLSTGDGVPCIR